MVGTCCGCAVRKPTQDGYEPLQTYLERLYAPFLGTEGGIPGGELSPTAGKKVRVHPQ